MWRLSKDPWLLTSTQQLRLYKDFVLFFNLIFKLHSITQSYKFYIYCKKSLIPLLSSCFSDPMILLSLAFDL